jgi:hypothetical protein
MTLRPATTQGHWTILLLLAFFAGLMVSAVSGQEGSDRFTDNWWLVGPAIVPTVSGLAALDIRLFAIVERGERSRWVMLAVVDGGAVAVFVASEVAFTH